jgi:TonB family protein
MGPFKFLPKESYRRLPVIKFLIHEDGTVSDAKVIRSSGVGDIDKKLLDSIVLWKYKPRPVGCGVVESEISMTIDFKR